MSTESEFSLLFRKYADGSATQDERLEFLALANREDMQATLARLVDTELQLRGTEYSLDKQEQEEILAHIYKAVPVYKTTPAKTAKLWPRIGIAAAVIGLAIGIYFFTAPRHPDTSRHPELVSGSQDIAPGTNAATLTLANGKKILINDAASGTLAEQHGVSISKTADGQIVYELKENKNGTKGYNTLQTGNGEQTRVRLQDGSIVNLNAASALTYPASFAGLAERRVKLKGEGYFKVHHDAKQPFKVETRGQVVEDIGTEFNINAYDDEAAVKTTLVEGSVKIWPDHAKNFKILKPGEQGTLRNDAVEVAKADTEQAIGWRNGDFVFNGEDLKAVMRQVARWYDVEVEYKGEVNISGIVSAFPRNKKLSQLLKALEASEGVHFKIEGRRILVMP